MDVILSVFIVSSTAIFRYVITDIVLLFLSSAATSPPSHLLLSFLLVRDLHEGVVKSYTAFVPLGSNQPSIQGSHTLLQSFRWW